MNKALLQRLESWHGGNPIDASQLLRDILADEKAKQAQRAEFLAKARTSIATTLADNPDARATTVDGHALFFSMPGDPQLGDEPFEACPHCRGSGAAADAKADESTIERVKQAVAEALGDAYDCMRVWSAWGVGTMGPGDFWLVSESDERLHEIAMAAIRAMVTPHVETSDAADQQ